MRVSGINGGVVVVRLLGEMGRRARPKTDLNVIREIDWGVQL